MNQVLTGDMQAPNTRFLEPSQDSIPDQEFYRIRCKSAVLAVLFGIFSLLGFVFMVFMLLAPLGIIFGWNAIRTIQRYPEEYFGKGMAQVGLLMGAISLFGGSGYHTFIYMTEVREGYERISFYGDLKNKDDAPTLRAQALDGKKVFLKGYVRPGLRRTGLTEFLMVGDFGDCCFGGSPNLTEVVYVKMPENRTAQYDFMLRRIHGTFRLNTRLQSGDRIANDVKGYIYEIEADFFD